jgi:nicotinate-nucleotide pyrophosphorylase (carboxylating)
MTLREYYKKYDAQFNRLILKALEEDRIQKDISSKIVLNKGQSESYHTAHLFCKEDCIIAGVDVFIKVFRLVNKETKFKKFFNDGQRIGKNTVVLEIDAPLGVLLSCERTALNIIQRMTGIATFTNKFVRTLKYKNSKILNTRKTTPNFRLFELAAFKTGGGDFYREDMSSSVMIKDNHIAAAGSIKNAIFALINNKKAREHFITIEVKNVKQAKDVILLGKNIINRVMLDNFRRHILFKTVKMLKNEGFEVELSGGLNMKNFSRLQHPGIDYYSIGCITHSYKSVDFSLEF